MVTKVRQASRFGTCDVLGEVINETSHAYIFRRPDGETAFISKRRRRSMSDRAACVRTIFSQREAA